MPQTPKQTRLVELEDTLRTKAWTMKLEGELALKWGVGRECVRRDLSTLKAALRERVSGATLEERRGLMVSRLEALAEQATAAGKVGPAAMTLKLLSSLQGLDVPPPREDDLDETPEPADALDALAARLRDTRRLRRAAERDGSYVAAQSLLKLEAELIGQSETEKRARADAARATASDAEALKEMEDYLSSLPASELDALVSRARSTRGV